MMGSQKNGADRVTKEKGLKSVKKTEEEMNEKRAQLQQAVGGGGFFIILIILAVALFLYPSKTVVELRVNVLQADSLSVPQIVNAQISNTQKPQISIFSNNPRGFYALTASLNSTKYEPLYKEFFDVGLGQSSLVVSNQKIYDGWSVNLTLYQFNQIQNRWDKLHSVNGVVDFGQ